MSSSSKAGRGARLSLRSPQARVVAGTVATALAVASFAFTGTSAGASSLPNAQSVGRFLDGSIGTTTVESIANVQDARAVNPGTTSVQNPLTATVLNQIKVPLNGALQLGPLLGIQNFGAANQVAVAKSDGYSYGASGAVDNSGGVSVGGNNAAYPANATLDLTGAGITGNSAGAILGGVTTSIGAVSALASTPAGAGKPGSTSYQIASLNLQLGSPLLKQLLGPVLTNVGSLLNKLSTSASLPGLPTSCILSSTTTVTSLSIDGGAVVIDLSGSTSALLTVDLSKVLQQLGLNLNALPANTDLVADLLKYLTSPTGLAAGLTTTINDLVNPLKTSLQPCLTALGPLGGLLATLLNSLSGLQTTLENTVSGVLGQLASALPTAPLQQLSGILGKVLDIGINVQPNGPSGTYTDALKATPAQDTAVVPGQTVVRAIEVNVLGKAINLALANAAAGPSAPATTPTTPASSTPASNVPTGVPAGDGTKGGLPTLPIVLLIVGLLTAASGVTAQRLRLRRTH